MIDLVQEAAAGIGQRPVLLDPDIAAENFLEQHRQLHFRQPRPHAAVDAVTEADMAAGIVSGEIDDIGVGKQILVTIGRNIPENDFLARRDDLAAQFGLAGGGPPHMGDGRLPADDFLRRIGHQRGILAQPFELVGEQVAGADKAAHAVARGVIAADDQQRNICQPLELRHIAHRVAVDDPVEILSFGGCWRSFSNNSSNLFSIWYISAKNFCIRSSL